MYLPELIVLDKKNMHAHFCKFFVHTQRDNIHKPYISQIAYLDLRKIKCPHVKCNIMQVINILLKSRTALT